MKKVIAFLEKYAEWVAMGFACVFILYMVYAYVVSPDDLRIPVGKEALMPGEVDTHIGAIAADLDNQVKDPVVNIQFPVPDFVKGFALAMSKDRDRMQPAFVESVAFRPSLAKGGKIGVDPALDKQYVEKLPIPPVMMWTMFNQGNSLVGITPPPVAGAAAPAVAPQPIPVEKNWIMGEGRIVVKSLDKAWKDALFDSNGVAIVPQELLLTHFLKVEVERQEQIDANLDQWTPAVPIPPLAIAEVKDYPKEGDREGQEEYRLWAEKNQVTIVEPPFYPVLHGDEWSVPSLKAKEKEATAAANAAKEGPFDPANPPTRPLTPEETRKVDQYKRTQSEAQKKADAAARKAKMDATRRTAPPAASGGGGGGGGGGRRIGGYAPLPGEGRNPGQRYDDGGRPIGPAGRPGGMTGRPNFERGGITRDGGRQPGALVNPTPTITNNGVVQNPALSQPFDPTALAQVDPNAAPASIMVWFHDDTVTPGKTYRYRVRYLLKNPVYGTQGATKNPKFEAQLAVASEWSEWSEVKAPSNTEFYFSRAVQPINGKINGVMVDVFKREKGDWYQGQFTIAPGDSIGTINKNKMDFTSGSTLVDIRPDVREKDLKILVSDDSGSIRVISFETQKADPWYASLKEKAKATAAAGPAAAAGNPALINEVGNR